jgi:hypothetical protein
MAVMPGAIFKPVARFNTPMAAYNRFNLHIAVSEADSLFSYFNQAGKPCSHFYVRYDGTIEQYVDTRFRAGSDYQGNDATISVETQGGYPSGGGQWTAAQVASLARIYRWLRATHGIENRIATDSRVGASSKGLSYHRFGIDPWRVSGGMYYSTKPGKVCPTDARIVQVPTVFAQSQDTTTPTAPAGFPLEDTMKLMHSGSRGYAIVGSGVFVGVGTMEEVYALQKVFGESTPVSDAQFDIVRRVAVSGTNAQANPAVGEAVWSAGIPKAEGGGFSAGPASARDFLRTVTLAAVAVKGTPVTVDTKAVAEAIAAALPSTLSDADVAKVVEAIKAIKFETHATA